MSRLHRHMRIDPQLPLEVGDRVTILLHEPPSPDRAQEVYRKVRSLVGYHCSVIVEVGTPLRSRPFRRLRLVK